MNDNTKRFSAATARLSVSRMMQYMTVNAFLNAWTRRHTLRRQTIRHAMISAKPSMSCLTVSESMGKLSFRRTTLRLSENVMSLNSKKDRRRGAFHKAGFICRKSQRSTSVLFVLLLYCRAVISLPCVKGGGSRKRDGGIVKAKISS